MRDGRRLIAVVLGGSSTAARDNNVQDLLNVGFDVMRRRDRGETVTVAQNLFEPEASGPIQRPSVEQGDADQPGLKIVMGQNLPIKVGVDEASAEEEFQQVRSATIFSVAQPCRAVRAHSGRGRHGRRAAHVVSRCGGARVIAVSDVKPCKVIGGKHRHGHAARCEARGAVNIAKADRHHGRKAAKGSRLAAERRKDAARES